MKKEISNEEVEKKILEIFHEAGLSPLSIREVTMKLKEKYDISLSPQIVKRYLFKLKEENKIQ